ncbi:MAG: TM2 domain-containing protein [Elusimicrobiota bacterium]|jgi:TM2 domain-containing membrane protein YozV|nr:TM2 domain-containing protein [Elusimicrobiota bacterium]
MEQKDRTAAFLNLYAKYFPPENIIEIKMILEGLDENQYAVLSASEFRDPVLMLIISIVGGYFGIDRFMLGQIGLGILKLITGGGCGIWWIVDLFLIQNLTKKKNYEKFCYAVAAGQRTASFSVDGDR